MSVVDAVNAGIARCRAKVHGSGRGFVVSNLPGVGGGAGAGAGALFTVEPTESSRSTWRGITDALKRAFWTKYDWTRAKARAKMVTSGKTTVAGKRALAAKRSYATKKGVSVATAGRHFGVALHAALATFINCSAPRGRPTSKPLSARALQEAKAVIRGLKSLGVTLLETEAAFRSARLGLATAVDILGWHETLQKLVVVELKRGFGGGLFETGSGAYMDGPVEGIPDSPRNQAHLQALTVAHWLIDEGGVPSNAIMTMVLRVDDTTQEVSYHRSPEWLWHNRRVLMDFFNSKVTDKMRGARVTKTKSKSRPRKRVKT